MNGGGSTTWTRQSLAEYVCATSTALVSAERDGSEKSSATMIRLNPPAGLEARFCVFIVLFSCSSFTALRDWGGLPRRDGGNRGCFFVMPPIA
jgi:hypothetical protein